MAGVTSKVFCICVCTRVHSVGLTEYVGSAGCGNTFVVLEMAIRSLSAEWPSSISGPFDVFIDSAVVVIRDTDDTIREDITRNIGNVVFFRFFFR